MTTKITIQMSEHDVEVITTQGLAGSKRELLKRETKSREINLYGDMKVELREIN